MATVNKDLGPVTAYAYAKEGGYTGTLSEFETDLANSANIANTIDEMLSGKADVADIPTKTTDLTNDSGFITNTVNNLVNYYTKTQTYTQEEVDALIAAVKNGRFISVATLPTTDIDTKAIYLVPSADPQAQNIKDEYINIDGTTAGWELIGSTAIDLSDYVTDEDLTTALANYTTTADLTTLLSGKQDTISDLATIRSGASAGATAYQKPSTGIPKTDLASAVQTSLGKADTAIQDISGKADKVSSATNNNFAALDANGNLKDSGHKHSDYLTQHQDISGKADKAVPSASGNVATLDANGNLTDSGMTLGKSVPSTAKFSDSNVGQYNTVDSNDYRILLSYSANDDAETGGVRKSSKLKFNHDTGNLQVPKINGVTVGSSPKFTDSGHTILNSSGTAMNQRGKLQFDGATVTDDPANDKTIVTGTPQSMIGDAWVTSHAYAVGDYCIDGNVLYKCKTAHTSSASYRPPYASYWDAVSVASQLKKGAYSTVKSLKSCSTLTKGSINGDGYVFASDGQMSFTVNASGWFKLQCVSIDTLATGKKSLVVTINNFSIETINENDSIAAWAYCFNYFPPIWINAGDSVSVSIATTYAPKLWVHAVSSWVIS